ncbi:MAG: tetratricopeptide repeat protein, partial [Elusimicrobiota bacterium]
VALPITLLALDVFPLRRLPADLRRWIEPKSRAVLWEKAPFFFFAAAFGVVEIVAYSNHAAAGLQNDGLILRAAKACYAVVFYALKTVAPFGLSPSYALPGRLALFACAASVAAVTWLLWRRRDRWPSGLPSWAHYIAALAPVLGWYKFGDHLVADRYSYLACAGWPILAAGGLWSLGRDRKTFRLALGAAAALIAGLSLLTWRQTVVWHDSISLWKHALALDANSVFARKSLGHAYYNRGNEFLNRGKPREAWQLYVESLRINPDNAETHSNMGAIQLKFGRLDEAIGRFRFAISLSPDYAFAYNGLGVALIRRGELEDGAANFCRALRIDPTLNGSAANLRAVLARYPRLNKGLDNDCRLRLTKPE